MNAQPAAARQSTTTSSKSVAPATLCVRGFSDLRSGTAARRTERRLTATAAWIVQPARRRPSTRPPTCAATERSARERRPTRRAAARRSTTPERTSAAPTGSSARPAADHLPSATRRPSTWHVAAETRRTTLRQRFAAIALYVARSSPTPLCAVERPFITRAHRRAVMAPCNVCRPMIISSADVDDGLCAFEAVIFCHC